VRKKFDLATFSIGVSLLAGGLGSISTFSAIPTWYQTLNKPFFSPPNFVFGPVWTTLYILMGIALYLILINKKRTKAALFVFFLQLFLNILWSFIFFGFKQPLLAFIEIIFLWLAILSTLLHFYFINKKAGYLLIPYLLWVSFASMLNLSVALLNL
jgi:translocator protein